MAKRNDLLIQEYVNNENLDRAKKELNSDTKLLAGLQAALISTNDPQEIASLNKQIDFMTKLTTAESNRVDALKQDSSMVQQILAQEGQAWSKYAQAIGADLNTGKDSAKQIMTQMMQDQIKIVGNGLLVQLEAKVAAWMSDPLTAVLALGGIAAISYIESLTGASSFGSAPSASTASSNASVASSTQTPGTSISVNVYGDSMSDPEMVARMATRISQAVTTLGIPFTASSLSTPGATSNPASTSAALQ
jgi:DhnA family fructose-bisphosphate aldolase class Ia